MKPSFLDGCASYLSYWNMLPEDEKEDYLRIIEEFRNEEKKTSKDKRIFSFPNERSKIINFIERSEVNKEVRCILVGICFCGPILCLNNRQLKLLTCRCKSSINGSFQKLGYVSILSKSKSKDCVLAALPSLKAHTTILRQWSSRYVSSNTLLCFIPSIVNIQTPEILPEDVHEEKTKSNHQKQVAFNPLLFKNQQKDEIINNYEEFINTDNIGWKTEQMTNYLSPMYSLEYENISVFNNPQYDAECCDNDDLFVFFPTDKSYRLELQNFTIID